MLNVKVLVASHKKYWMPEDPMYLPIHVGKAGNEDIGFTGDDTGENISAKNPFYCELTAVYWAWKNLKADYIGLAHYRRHFTALPIWRRIGKDKKDCVLTSEQATDILRTADVILPIKRRYYIETNQSHYAHAHHAEDLLKTQEIIGQKYPEYLPSCQLVFSRSSAHMFNMFIMKRNYFSAYCEWLFGVLGELEKRLDLSSYSAVDARVFGYVGELLLDVWLEKEKIRYRELPVMFMEKRNWLIKGGKFVARKFRG